MLNKKKTAEKVTVKSGIAGPVTRVIGKIKMKKIKK
jgi:hypothetical protein